MLTFKCSNKSIALDSKHIYFKVKLAVLTYLRSLVTLVESADIPSGKEAELALAKLITWTGEPKSAEIRREANLVVAGLFQAHSPQMQVTTLK